MLLKDYIVAVENGSYLVEEGKKFTLHEVKNGKTSEYLKKYNGNRINLQNYVPIRHELIRVNHYNPSKWYIQNDVNINGVYVYVPPKITINYDDGNGNISDQYPTVLKLNNMLIFCSFDDLYNILNKVLKYKGKNVKFEDIFNCQVTKLNKKFCNMIDEKEVTIELILLNMCKDPDLMKNISPYFFVKDLLENCKINNEKEIFNDEDFLFWGVIKYNKKYYLSWHIFNEYYALEMLDCYPMDIPNEKLQVGVNRISFSDEDNEAFGAAYKRLGENYCLRIWIKVEEYLRKFYEKIEYITEDSEIEECVKRHLNILYEEESPLYYELEKEVPPIIFVYDIERVIKESKELLIEIVDDELNNQLHGM